MNSQAGLRVGRLGSPVAGSVAVFEDWVEPSDPLGSLAGRGGRPGFWSSSRLYRGAVSAIGRPPNDGLRACGTPACGIRSALPPPEPPAKRAGSGYEPYASKGQPPSGALFHERGGPPSVA